MIRLNMPKEPYWIELPYEVRVFVRPLGTAIYKSAQAKGYRLARQIASEQLEIVQSGGEVSGLPDSQDEDGLAGLSQFLFAKALAVAAIIRWEGVLGEDGEIAPVTEETVGELMALPQFADEFLIKYSEPYELLTAEGNGSGPVPNGTSEAGPDTVKDVESKD